MFIFWIFLSEFINRVNECTNLMTTDFFCAAWKDKSQWGILRWKDANLKKITWPKMDEPKRTQLMNSTFLFNNVHGYSNSRLLSTLVLSYLVGAAATLIWLSLLNDDLKILSKLKLHYSPRKWSMSWLSQNIHTLALMIEHYSLGTKPSVVTIRW